MEKLCGGHVISGYLGGSSHCASSVICTPQCPVHKLYFHRTSKAMEMAGLLGTAGGGSAGDVQARNLLARLRELMF